MEQTSNKEKIEKIFKAFRIGVESVVEYVGSTHTLYEVKPSLGVKVTKIRNLKDEIAAEMEVPSVRVIAPMENGHVGIEIPNKKREIISIWDMIGTDIGRDDMELPIAIGKTVTGEVFVTDLAEMPHLLIAGATGQGKSVCLNTILLSLIRAKSDSDLKFLLIDPKRVELTPYNGLSGRYLLRPVVSEAQYAEYYLEVICDLMEARYKCLNEVGARNIKEFNAISSRQFEYIVVVIDEYGDLIMSSGKKMEQLICRIAQKARAVGIHMIISTQRPSATIVTGNIKANFPTRIAFRTATGIDSRVIIDQQGAEKLMGKGDMLFFGNGGVRRVQCAYTSTSDVQAVVRAFQPRLSGE